MRKTLTRLLVAALAASSLIASTPMTSGANPIQELLVDLQVSIESKPATVSPAGAPAVYDIVVTNTGALATSSATVTVTLPTGGSFIAGCAPTCNVGPLNPGESESFSTVASTPATPSTGDGYVTSATVADVAALGLDGVPVVEAIENSDNNTDTTFTVVFNDPNNKSGFIPENGSVAIDLPDGRSFQLRVPSGVPGVILKYLKASDRTYLCGTQLCDDGFALDFVPHPYYQALDPNNALEYTMDFGPALPCRGIGGGSTCAPDVFTGVTVDDPVLVEAPFCIGAGAGPAAPGSGDMAASPTGYYYSCINDEWKAGDTFYFDGRMRSVDPPLIPLNF